MLMLMFCLALAFDAEPREDDPLAPATIDPRTCGQTAHNPRETTPPLPAHRASDALGQDLRRVALDELAMFYGANPNRAAQGFGRLYGSRDFNTRIARSAHHQGHLQAAMHLRRVLLLQAPHHPDHPRHHAALVRIALQTGDHPQILAELEALRHLAPDSPWGQAQEPEAHAHAAEVVERAMLDVATTLGAEARALEQSEHFELGNARAEAMRAFAVLLHGFGGLRESWVDIAEEMRTIAGQAVLDHGWAPFGAEPCQIATAHLAFAEAFPELPATDTALHLAAEALAQIDLVESAAVRVRLLERLDPTDERFAHHSLELARQQEALGDLLGAVDAYETLARWHPQPDLLWTLATRHAALGQQAQAAEQYRRLQAFFPQHPRAAHARLAFAHHRLTQGDEAPLRAMLEDSRTPPALMWRGYARLGRSPGARRRPELPAIPQPVPPDQAEAVAEVLFQATTEAWTAHLALNDLDQRNASAYRLAQRYLSIAALPPSRWTVAAFVSLARLRLHQEATAPERFFTCSARPGPLALASSSYTRALSVAHELGLYDDPYTLEAARYVELQTHGFEELEERLPDPGAWAGRPAELEPTP